MALSTVPSAVCIDSDTGGRAVAERPLATAASRAPGDGDSRLRIRSLVTPSARASSASLREEPEQPAGDVCKAGDELAPRVVGPDEVEGKEQGSDPEQRAIDTPQRQMDVRDGLVGQPDDRKRDDDLHADVEHARGPAHDGASRLTQVSRGMRGGGGGGGAAAPGSFCGPERSSEPSTRRVPPSWPTGLLPRTERSWPRSSTCGE